MNLTGELMGLNVPQIDSLTVSETTIFSNGNGRSQFFLDRRC